MYSVYVLGYLYKMMCLEDGKDADMATKIGSEPSKTEEGVILNGFYLRLKVEPNHSLGL
jgi:hypothetical protein